MQKAVRLNILTRNNTAKQSKKVLERKTKEEWKEWHQHTNRQKAIQVEHEAEERLTRRQDWMAGPLAPNRNSGLQKGIYGTIELGLGTLPDVPKSVRAGPKTKGYAVTTDDEKDRFKGTTIVGNVVENDRVVIVAGPERLRGLIGTVNHVDMEKEEVKLRNVNTVDVANPAYVKPPRSTRNQEPLKYSTLDLPIPMSHVRLVVQITTPEGDAGEAIIRHIHAGPPYIQRDMGSNIPSHTRYATGVTNQDPETNEKRPMELPWPNPTFVDSFEHFPGDTQRAAVTAGTWSVSMYDPPLGYRGTLPKDIAGDDNPYTRAQALNTIDVRGPRGLSNPERTGVMGFVNEQALIARQRRIASGIMNELRPKHLEVSRQSDLEYVRRRMLEDARAIWYGQRQLSTPTAQAAQRAVEIDAKAREERVRRNMQPDVIEELQRQVQMMKDGDLEEDTLTSPVGTVRVEG